MNVSDVQEVADLLKALGEFNRLSLVYELCGCEKPKNVMCLCSCCDVDTSVVSRHLKNGRERNYALNRDHVVSKLRTLADKIERHMETS